MVFAERLLWLAAGLSSRVQSSFRVGLCVSLLLHALLLAVWTAPGAPRVDPGRGAPLPALKLRLHMPEARVETPSAVPPPGASGLARARRTGVLAVPARPPVPLAKEAVAATEPPPPSFNVDNLRAQARSLAHRPSESLVRRPEPHRNLAPAADPAALDRPFLDALSRRLGRTLVVASETAMSDGSRLIRFADNTCLRVPQHLPEWQKNPMGATVLVAMTCGS